MLKYINNYTQNLKKMQILGVFFCIEIWHFLFNLHFVLFFYILMMKIGLKSLIFWVSWLAVLLIWWCSNVLVSKEDSNMCDAVKEYLANADLKWKWQAVQKWDSIVVDYIGRLADGTVFDTSVESVARWCGTYNEGRNYDEWLAFEVWAGQMIAGFDKWVEWMKIWQTRTIEIAAKDAYGERDESLVVEINKSDLENPGQYEEWQTLYTPYGQAVKVYKVTKDKIYIDTNHELAGKTLIFDITIKEIK